MTDEILWFGEPPADMTPEREQALLAGPGDLWHSGLTRGCAGQLGELRYWSPVYWWFLNDVPTDRRGVSWRADASAFGVRASAWEAAGGFDEGYATELARGLDLGFRLLQNGAVPLYVPALFPPRTPPAGHGVPPEDLYLFFVRHFKGAYQHYALLRQSTRKMAPLSEWRAYRAAKRTNAQVASPATRSLPPRPLVDLPTDPPRVSAVVPTWRRQDYTAALLGDLSKQTLPLHQVTVVDGTPEEERDESIYAPFFDTLPLTVIWQTSRGLSRARNEAIAACNGDYVLFTDDDIRVGPDYVENHVRVLLTYGAEATNGLDVRADHHEQDLDDLARKLAAMPDRYAHLGADTKFNNADSCVRQEKVSELRGNDVALDGGYGDDIDFGHRIFASGGVVLRNPYSSNLHLKPPAGGLRWWEKPRRARREARPWELKRRVGWIAPKPSPTMLYLFHKLYQPEQVREWRLIYLLRAVWPSYAKPHESRATRLLKLVPRALRIPFRLWQMRISERFASDLLERGPIYD